MSSPDLRILSRLESLYSVFHSAMQNLRAHIVAASSGHLLSNRELDLADNFESSVLASITDLLSETARIDGEPLTVETMCNILYLRTRLEGFLLLCLLPNMLEYIAVQNVSVSDRTVIDTLRESLQKLPVRYDCNFQEIYNSGNPLPNTARAHIINLVSLLPVRRVDAGAVPLMLAAKTLSANAMMSNLAPRKMPKRVTRRRDDFFRAADAITDTYSNAKETIGTLRQSSARKSVPDILTSKEPRKQAQRNPTVDQQTFDYVFDIVNNLTPSSSQDNLKLSKRDVQIMTISQLLQSILGSLRQKSGNEPVNIYMSPPTTNLQKAFSA